MGHYASEMADNEPVDPVKEREKLLSILCYFQYSHLPLHLGTVSEPFFRLAHQMASTIAADSEELRAGLRKLLEAKDCMVRAALNKK